MPQTIDLKSLKTAYFQDPNSKHPGVPPKDMRQDSATWVLATALFIKGKKCENLIVLQQETLLINQTYICFFFKEEEEKREETYENVKSFE